jgi:basic amino acid/polyamine antiporter, APA family
LLLVGISVFVFRRRDPTRHRRFRVPLYPLTPIVFCLTCLWMLYSSVAYAGVGALVGIAVLLAGTALGLIRSRLPQVASSQSWSPRRQSLTCERAARFERTR